MNYKIFLVLACSVYVAAASPGFAQTPVIGFPTPTATGTAVPAKPKPDPKVFGRCNYPSLRPLASLLQTTIASGYTKSGYNGVLVTVRILTPKTLVTELAFGNISGVSKLAPKPGSPLQVDLQGGTASSPVEIGCALEAKIDVRVSVIESTTGKRVENTSTSTIVVRGAFS